jgi:hypothetical protein
MVIVALFAAPGFADTVVGDPDITFEPDYFVEDPQEGSMTPAIDEDSINTYGTQDFIELNLGLVGFSPIDDGEWTHLFNGWGWRNSGGNTATCHVVNIPSGALIDGYTVWLIDNSAAGSVRYEFYRNNLLVNNQQNILTFSSSGTPGIFRSFRDIIPDHRVLNDRAVYWVCINNTVTGNSLQSSGVTFWYKLTISPAPASPSFSDVPTFHPFFREIEALARSGISTGFPDGTFRPSAVLTRQAMAAFLARALGLHWPDL